MINAMNTTAASLLVVGAAAMPAFAHGEGDIGLLFSGNRIVTAIADDEDGMFEEVGERVFAGEISPVSNLADGPGFFTTDGPTLPSGFDTLAAGSTISYENRGPLLGWDGVGFSATTQQLRQIVIPGVLETITPTTDTVTPGFEFGYAGGDFDEHPDYSMSEAGNTGVYLWRLAFSAFDSSGGLITSSDEVWVVFNFGEDEEIHELALEWAESNVPAPGVAAAFAVVGIGASRRRRS